MRHAIIIGGGVGGLATAIALRQAGVEATVYEAYPDPTRDAAAFLSVAANGMTMLRRLECLDPVMARGFRTPTITIWSGSGKRLGTLPFAGSEYTDLAGLTIKRSELVAALMAQAQHCGVPVQTGKQLTDATATADGGVLATFADGAQIGGDILIGADGTHSRVRQIIDPAAPRPHYTGLIGAGGYAEADADPDVPANMFNMVFGKHAFFGYTRHPGGAIWWFANVPRPREPTKAELAAVSSAEWKRHLLETFADDASPAASIIEATDHPLRPHASHLMPTVTTWHRNTMILIGDAAHCASPSSGQGASMALEDAIMLAKCLRDIPEPPAAFAAYDHARRERVQRVVKHGARGNRSKTLGPISSRLAELLMPTAFKYLARSKSLQWQYTYDIDWTTPTTASI